MHAAGSVELVVIFDVGGPRLAPDLHEDALLDVVELDHNEGGDEAVLVHVGEVNGREALAGGEGHVAHVLVIWGVLKIKINETI